MEKGQTLPAPVSRSSTRRSSRFQHLALLVAAAVLLYPLSYSALGWTWTRSDAVPINAQTILAQCKALDLQPGPPDDFYARKQSDRFEDGTKPTLIRNATIWTGQDDGKEVLTGDILLDKGIIQKLGSVDVRTLSADTVVLDADGAWVSPGIVDMHSHLGVYSAPELDGSSDGNSLKGLALPWLRSLDGLNTHDDAYKLSISGGVTTANVLPGSADAIGGQAFVIKLRPTRERSSNAMLLEPPFTLNGSFVDPNRRPRWRQMKHACGENPSRVYSGTRMDTTWAFRNSYESARLVKEEQDAYCRKALAGEWTGLGEFPFSLQWEALVDVLRGRVKVHNHCYEAVDLSNQVRLTNEFKFPIAAFHHAHETYLVPDLLKQAHGGAPAVAIFATTSRYKREAYRGSEFAARILADNGLTVVMKSDHPVINSRHLVFEAQLAHYYGLAENMALASVTSTPAKVMATPLALGAAPKQVFVDGIAQIADPAVSTKPKSAQAAPKTPNWDKEAEDAVKYEGLPPLEPVYAEQDVVVFTNVGSIFVKDPKTNGVKEVYSSATKDGVVVVEKGRLVCTGTCSNALARSDALHIDLEGGSIQPGLVSFGTPMGLDHIPGEPSTNDGPLLDPLTSTIPALLKNTAIKAADGLQFASRDALLAFRNGITTAVVAPVSYGFLGGLSTVFRTDAPHKLADGAVTQDVAALHVTVSMNLRASVSSQIGALKALLGSASGNSELAFDAESADLVAGIPLVVRADNADIIASLLAIKSTYPALRLVIAGGAEAHLLADELAAADVGVLIEPRPYPGTWEQRRILPGPPGTKDSAIAKLVRAGVKVGVMALAGEAANVMNTRFDLSWVGLESGGLLSKADVLALGSSNIETLLGVKEANMDLVAIKGGADFEGKVVAVVSARSGKISLV
ncbi:Carbohydrate esterase family 9 protein [Mycena kentingensis (nom. inval.)]|nr:Carbohydrate esterase family 9 protein [Mycena kentingensis (nom. inval.)]